MTSATACTRLNESHCGNQQGDETCVSRDSALPFCNVCVADNDGCVAERVTDPQCGSVAGDSSSSSTLTGPGISSTDNTTTPDGSGPGESTSSGTSCGNGVIDADEACDGTMLPEGTDCSSAGFGEGTPTCLDDCTMVDYSSCSRFIECGNGEVGPKEECDGENFGGQSCADFPGLTGNGLVCNADCTIDTSGCQPCRESRERCSPGADLCCNPRDVCDGLLGEETCCQGPLCAL